MFNVVDKNDPKYIRTVYQIAENANTGAILFLVYDETIGQWVYERADDFKPLKESNQ